MWLDVVYEICGGESALFLAAYATIADETDEKMRTFRCFRNQSVFHLLKRFLKQFLMLFEFFFLCFTSCPAGS